MDTPQTLSSRNAVVTGSTSGIGAATARALAARGASVVVTGRNVERGQQVVASVRDQGGRATFIEGDLTAPPNELRALAARWASALGGDVDILVHNAAMCPPVDTLNLTDDDLETTMALNLRAPHVLTAAIVPTMVGRGRGVIVVIGSWMATMGHPFVGFYSATKAAEAQLARSWAAEFGPLGIRVNTVAPGVTRPAGELDDDDPGTRMTLGTPAGRPGTPEEVAAVVAWLASDESSYVQGALLPVDGGISATR